MKSKIRLENVVLMSYVFSVIYLVLVIVLMVFDMPRIGFLFILGIAYNLLLLLLLSFVTLWSLIRTRKYALQEKIVIWNKFTLKVSNGKTATLVFIFLLSMLIFVSSISIISGKSFFNYMEENNGTLVVIVNLSLGLTYIFYCVFNFIIKKSKNNSEKRLNTIEKLLEKLVIPFYLNDKYNYEKLSEIIHILNSAKLSKRVQTQKFNNNKNVFYKELYKEISSKKLKKQDENYIQDFSVFDNNNKLISSFRYTKTSLNKIVYQNLIMKDNYSRNNLLNILAKESISMLTAHYENILKQNNLIEYRNWCIDYINAINKLINETVNQLNTDTELIKNNPIPQFIRFEDMSKDCLLLYSIVDNDKISAYTLNKDFNHFVGDYFTPKSSSQNGEIMFFKDINSIINEYTYSAIDFSCFALLNHKLNQFVKDIYELDIISELKINHIIEELVKFNIDDYPLSTLKKLTLFKLE